MAATIPQWTALAVKELLRHDAAAGLLRAGAVDAVVADLVEGWSGISPADVARRPAG